MILMPDLKTYTLSQILEILNENKFPNDSDLERLEEIEKALSNYGNITYGEYLVKKYSNMTEKELVKLRKENTCDGTTDFTEDFRNRGTLGQCS